MLAITIDRLGTIQRASRALLIFFIFMSVISLWGMANSIVHPFPPDSRTLAGVVFQGAAITGKVHGLWLVQMVLSAVLSLKVLYHLTRLMMLYTKGKLFTTESVAQIHLIGLTYAFWPVAWLVGLIGAAPEIAAAQDQWTSILPSFPGGALVACCLFLFASGIMDEGRKLREEQDLVV
jgi:hypothetical protein